MKKLNVAAFLVAGAAAAAYTVFARPVIKGWGSTEAEWSSSYPGDEIFPNGITTTMHAITINETPGLVWRYILQIGQDRAGFYSYDWLERLIGAEIHNNFELREEWQERKVGDAYLMAPPTKFGGKAKLVVAQMLTNVSLVLITPKDWENMHINKPLEDGCWAFYLKPVNGGQTRLIVRSRDAKARGPLNIPWSEGFNAAHFVMERKMLLTIKALAEKTLVPTAR